MNFICQTTHPVFSQNIINRVPKNDGKDIRPVYDGVELVEGWKVVGRETAEELSTNGKPQKQVLTSWVEHCISDSFEDAHTFASDLATSLEYHIEKCITSGAITCNFFDIEETLILLCGEELDSGRIKMKAGDLEEHGTKEFSYSLKKCVL
mgnify:CR=1 FL=1